MAQSQPAERLCKACGKPMPRAHHMANYHYACKVAMPGYKIGYQDGLRAGRKSVARAARPEPAPRVRSIVHALTPAQREQIAREVLLEKKAELERDIADKRAQMALLEGEKERAERHKRMLEDGWDLPPFEVDQNAAAIVADAKEATA